jgi:fructosamine-3-kinase
VSLRDDVAAATGRAVGALTPISGGDLNDAYRVEFSDGGEAFVKTRSGATRDEYETEAAGLRWLARPFAIALPEVLAVGDPFLVLEWIESPGPIDHALLGHGLALLHKSGAEAHGSPPPGAPTGDLRLGPVVLPGATADRWPPFYGEHRLLPLLAQAHDKGAIDSSGVEAVERVCARIDELSGPDEPPARLHGDLWSGNVMSGPDGPVLIDPAAYGGHREIDIAMLQLFDSTPPAFFAAYEEFHPLADGHQERMGLWQLFPLLVHAVLFGGGYGAQVAQIAARYA